MLSIYPKSYFKLQNQTFCLGVTLEKNANIIALFLKKLNSLFASRDQTPHRILEQMFEIVFVLIRKRMYMLDKMF